MNIELQWKTFGAALTKKKDRKDKDRNKNVEPQTNAKNTKIMKK